MRHKLMGVFPGPFHSNLPVGTLHLGRLFYPSNQIWEWRHATALWLSPAEAALNTVFRVSYHPQELHLCKWHLPSKKSWVRISTKKFKRGQSLKTTISRGPFNSHSFFFSLFSLNKKGRGKSSTSGITKDMQMQSTKTFTWQQSERSSAKSLQTINAQGVLDNCIPSSCCWDVKW